MQPYHEYHRSIHASFSLSLSCSDLVMDEVLNCIKQSKEPSQALDLVKFAADFSLQSTSKLARRALEEFQLSEEQR